MQRLRLLLHCSLCRRLCLFLWLPIEDMEPAAGAFTDTRDSRPLQDGIKDLSSLRPVTIPNCLPRRALVMTLFMLRRVRNCRRYYYYNYRMANQVHTCLLNLQTIAYRSSTKLAELLQYHKLTRSTRSSASHLLSDPRHNLSFGSRAFRISAPKIWNSLPPQILQFQTLSSFRRHLMTHYFQSAYSAP